MEVGRSETLGGRESWTSPEICDPHHPVAIATKVVMATCSHGNRYLAGYQASKVHLERGVVKKVAFSLLMPVEGNPLVEQTVCHLWLTPSGHPPSERGGEDKKKLVIATRLALPCYS